MTTMLSSSTTATSFLAELESPDLLPQYAYNEDAQPAVSTTCTIPQIQPISTCTTQQSFSYNMPNIEPLVGSYQITPQTQANVQSTTYQPAIQSAQPGQSTSMYYQPTMASSQPTVGSVPYQPTQSVGSVQYQPIQHSVSDVASGQNPPNQSASEHGTTIHYPPALSSHANSTSFFNHAQHSVAPRQQHHDALYSVINPAWKLLMVQSSSRTNFAWKVVKRLFSMNELVGHNCRGIKKPALDGEKLAAVEEICFYHFPITNPKDVNVLLLFCYAVIVLVLMLCWHEVIFVTK